jgi:hypothetical protein
LADDERGFLEGALATNFQTALLGKNSAWVSFGC